GHANAHFCEGMAGFLEQFRRVQQRLRGNATDVEASAAESFLFLDHRGFETELRRTDGTDIAAGAGADDDEIVGRHKLANRNLRRHLCQTTRPQTERESAPADRSWARTLRLLCQDNTLRGNCSVRHTHCAQYISGPNRWLPRQPVVPDETIIFRRPRWAFCSAYVDVLGRAAQRSAG